MGENDLKKVHKGFTYIISEIDEGYYCIETYKNCATSDSPTGGFLKMNFMHEEYADTAAEAFEQFKEEIPPSGWDEEDIF